MTVRYVGTGGNDGNSGLTWALRKETLNGVEDTPVVAGDTIYVGPGTYREELACDVAGSDGNIITYIADITGENTDGIGGIVRVTGSDSDISLPNTRSIGLNIDTVYRTFRGFYLDEFASAVGNYGAIYINASNVIVEYCVFGPSAVQNATPDYVDIHIQSTCTFFTIRNCIFLFSSDKVIEFTANQSYNNSIIENCLVIGGRYGKDNISLTNCWDIVIRHCSFTSGYRAANMINQSGGETIYVYDCLAQSFGTTVFRNVTAGTMIRANQLGGDNSTDLVGENTLAKWIPLNMRMLKDGYKFPYDEFLPTTWNDNIYAPDTSVIDVDIYGLDRPGKKTRGAIQIRGVERSTAQYRTAPSSIMMEDTGKHIMTIPVEGGRPYSVTAYVYKEADYSGPGPEISLRCPVAGQSVLGDGGGTGSWNKVTASLKTDPSDKFMQIELRSNNLSTSGSYKIYWDDIKVKGITAAKKTMRFITNDYVIFGFPLDDILDPWIGATIPVPAGAPISVRTPLPGIIKQEA